MIFNLNEVKLKWIQQFHLITLSWSKIRAFLCNLPTFTSCHQLMFFSQKRIHLLTSHFPLSIDNSKMWIQMNLKTSCWKTNTYFSREIRCWKWLIISSQSVMHSCDTSQFNAPSPLRILHYKLRFWELGYVCTFHIFSSKLNL